MSSFELWDRESQNLVGDFSSQDEALAFVRSLAEQDGELAAAALSLSEASGDHVALVATGAELLDLAGVVRAA